MKIVVVNSSGPMGSTVLGAMIEKFGYLNIPVRKTGLHDYLLKNRSPEDGFMQRRIEEICQQHSKVINSGGVSVRDRGSSKPRQLIDQVIIREALEDYKKKKYHSVADLYNDGRLIYGEGIVYKKSKHIPGKHVEFTTDISHFNPESLYNAYNTCFDNVYMINLRRDFAGWVESLISQRLFHTSLKTRCLFVFHSAVKQYRQYTESIAGYPGLEVDFDSLFIPANHQLIKKIADFIDEPLPDINWEEERYDLYGKICDYEKAFRQADLQYTYLSPFSIKLMDRLAGKEKISIFDDFLVYMVYLMELCKFSIGKFLGKAGDQIGED